MDSLLIFQVILPIAISIFGWLVSMPEFKQKCWRWVILILATGALSMSLVLAYIQRPKLVIVPDIQHHWQDQAFVLCKDVGLIPEIVPSLYTRRAPAGRVLEQSLSPGSEVFRRKKIILTVSRGEPVPDSLMETELKSKTKEATE